MNIACQCGEILDIADVLLVVEDSLVEVRDTPAQGDIVVEELRKLGCCLACVGVTPGAERHEDLLLLVEGHIAVHHSTEADGSEGFDLAVVLLLYILAQFGVAVLKSVPDSLGRVGP